MRTFENFRKVVNESDYILSEAQRYLEILLEKDSEALKQYKASKKSFQKGFGKNIKPTVVQPGLDLYKAGGPFVPDKTTFADTGKKVPKMEKKPQFGTPKTTSTSKTGAPDKTLLKKAIADVKASEKRLFDKGLGKGTAGIKGVEGKKGISLARQRAYTKQIIKDLSAKTTKADARVRGSSTEGSAGASSSSKTVTPTKGVKQSEVSKKAKDFTKEINQKRTTTPKTTNVFNRVKPKGDGLVKNSKGVGNMYRGNSPEAIQLRKQAIAARSGSGVVVRDKVTSSDRVNKGFTTSASKKPVSFTIKGAKGPTSMKDVKLPFTGVTAKGNPSRAIKPFAKITSQATIKDIAKQKGNLKQLKNYRYYAGAKKLAAKSPIAKKAIVGAGRILGSLGTRGRIAAGALSFIPTLAANPGVRSFVRNTAIFGTAAAALGLAKPKQNVLKVGKGVTKTTNLPSKFQPKNAKNLSYVDAYGKKRKLESGDVRFKFGLTGTKKNKDGTVTPGGMQYNKQDMARVKNIQKKYIDSYNASVKGNPFKKQIKYKVEKDGSYTVTPPKKK